MRDAREPRHDPPPAPLPADAAESASGSVGEAVTGAFRAAMRRLPAGVALVTSRSPDGSPHGMAASAVMPVSMDPPSMLVAINRTAGLHPVVQSVGRFCVNLLAQRQHRLLEPFSQTARRAERFASGDWQDTAGGLPCLSGASAVVDCLVERAIEYGTHTVFIGRVLEVRVAHAAGIDPLVWLDGRPASIARDAAPAPMPTP